VTNDGVADQLVVGQLVGLVEHAEGDTTATGDATGIRFDASRQQSQQCRFTVAIAPDDADAVALIEPDGEAVEYDTGRVLEVQRLSAKKVGHWLKASRDSCAPWRGSRCRSRCGSA